MGALVNVPVGLAPGLGLNGVFAVIASAAPCWSENGLHKPFSTDKELFNAFKAMQDETLDTYLPTIGQSATLNAATGKYGGCSAWGKTNLPWTDAMGAVFISGWFYLFFTFTGLRSMMFKAVPKSLRASIAVGIGFFITIIGASLSSPLLLRPGFGAPCAVRSPAPPGALALARATGGRASPRRGRGRGVGRPRLAERAAMLARPARLALTCAAHARARPQASRTAT